MPELVAGVLLSPDEARYAVAAFDALLGDGRRATPRLAAFIDKLRKSGAPRQVSGALSGADARVVAPELDSLHATVYDLVDSSEAARILGITNSGVRDLCRRGALPGRRAGGRWVIPVAAVVARAERQAARRR